MKIMHILKTEPDNNTKTLMSAFNKSEGGEAMEFKLYDEQADYEELIDLIFEHDKIISWW
ncbi:MAG: hypothetical protein ABIJ44_07175 [Pseudomonadota bacterium]